ncbi:hypothetical protein [Bacteroides reticulotermitis]|uniref:Uncharacterized protein n=1 Tax=Bacteroides reticulotermitis TaxID=1133319 RepID=A0A840D057_9BACE|nr:hypothetical protein [Bacteroides reticulotermitis]MBB4044189.1 hypothetical protein [Bacteroides reticulotermitis]HJD76358.1 hypothetical protein [Bacteroides reticulotermitis]
MGQVIERFIGNARTLEEICQANLFADQQSESASKTTIFRKCIDPVATDRYFTNRHGSSPMG